MFNAITQRESATPRRYRLHWQTPARLDPTDYTIHDHEGLELEDYLYLYTRQLQVEDHFHVKAGGDEVPASAAYPAWDVNSSVVPSGAHWYDRVPQPFPEDDTEDTVHWMLVRGESEASLKVESHSCPDTGGCEQPPLNVDDRGRVMWSDASIWPEGVVPGEDEDVVVPYGWDLVRRLSRGSVGGASAPGAPHRVGSSLPASVGRRVVVWMGCRWLCSLVG